MNAGYKQRIQAAVDDAIRTHAEAGEWRERAERAEAHRDALMAHHKNASLHLCERIAEVKADRDAALDLLRELCGGEIGDYIGALMRARAFLARVDSGTSRSAVGKMGLSGNLKVGVEYRNRPAEDTP